MALAGTRDTGIAPPGRGRVRSLRRFQGRERVLQRQVRIVGGRAHTRAVAAGGGAPTGSSAGHHHARRAAGGEPQAGLVGRLELHRPAGGGRGVAWGCEGKATPQRDTTPSSLDTCCLNSRGGSGSARVARGRGQRQREGRGSAGSALRAPSAARSAASGMPSAVAAIRPAGRGRGAIASRVLATRLTQRSAP